MNALRQSSGQGSSALLVDGEEKAMEVDSDWVEELAVEEDDSQAEDSVRSYPVLSLLHLLMCSRSKPGGQRLKGRSFSSCSLVFSALLNSGTS